MNKVALYGGLGNQMFQYAFKLALNKEGIKSDISLSNFLYQNHHNGFELNKAFFIDLSFSQKMLCFILSNAKPLYKNKYSRFFLKFFILNIRRAKFEIYNERIEFLYDEDVFKKNKTFFIGTWQVENYFSNIENTIQNSFKFKKPEDKLNVELEKIIRQTNSVSIHIRRGDYLKPQWKNILGFIDHKIYYNNCISHIENLVDKPTFFVFSDDTAWVQNNLNIENALFISNNKSKYSYIDMYLMSICKHNIIANSTFSWWAAWLNTNPDKIVLMPEKWINNNENSGIYPKNWIKIPI